MRSSVLVTFSIGVALALACGSDKKECKTEEGASEGASLAEGDTSKAKCSKSSSARDVKDTVTKDDVNKILEEPLPPEEAEFTAKKVTLVPADPQEPGDFVLVVSGGFSSLALNSRTVEGTSNMDIYDAVFASAKEELRKVSGTEPLWFITGIGPHPVEDAKRIFWNSSLGGGSGTIGDVVAAFDALLASANNPRIHMVGHSYGGSTVLALSTGYKSKGSVSLITLLDPISFYACTPSRIANAVLFAKKAPLGCQRAPKEGEFDLKRLTAASTKRVMYYQEGFQYLRATAMTADGWESINDSKYTKVVGVPAIDPDPVKAAGNVDDHNKFQMGGAWVARFLSDLGTAAAAAKSAWDAP